MVYTLCLLTYRVLCSLFCLCSLFPPPICFSCLFFAHWKLICYSSWSHWVDLRSFMFFCHFFRLYWPTLWILLLLSLHVLHHELGCKLFEREVSHWHLWSSAAFWNSEPYTQLMFKKCLNYIAEETVNKTKRHLLMGEDICKWHTR